MTSGAGRLASRLAGTSKRCHPRPGVAPAADAAAPVRKSPSASARAARPRPAAARGIARVTARRAIHWGSRGATLGIASATARPRDLLAPLISGRRLRARRSERLARLGPPSRQPPPGGQAQAVELGRGPQLEAARRHVEGGEVEVEERPNAPPVV